jgi:hypothetical protein
MRTYCTYNTCAVFHLGCCRALTEEKLKEIKKAKEEIEVFMELPDCFELEEPLFTHEC